MKRIAFLLAVCIVCFSGCKIKKPAAQVNSVSATGTANTQNDTQHQANYSDQVTWLLGYFNPSRLMNEPHSAWFYKGYDDYQPDEGAMKMLAGINRDGLSIKIVMGTWCPDSRREVPRFMRILDLWNFPADKVTFIGVDNGKQAPVGGFDSLDIQRVPTFIIYKNNVEAGRIIENPVTSLEQDMVNILTETNNNK